MPALVGSPTPIAPGGYFIFTDASILVLTLLCLVHAFRRGGAALAYLLGGVAFGFLLETFEVVTDSYTYGPFGLMFGHAPKGVPLFVGLSWGIIMYTARLFSDARGLPLAASAAFDTLLALNLDLGMDVVAYRMHFWNWDWSDTPVNPLTVEWFGIPWANFVGWITVVFCYSLFARLFEVRLSQLRASIRLWSVPLLALICSLAVLVGTELVVFRGLNRIGFGPGWRFLGSTVLMLVLWLRGLRRRRTSSEPASALALLVPGWFHLFFLACFFALGYYRENRWMTAATCLNLLVAAGLHFYPAAMRLPAPLQAAEAQASDVSG